MEAAQFSRIAAELLNQNCDCVVMDEQLLQGALTRAGSPRKVEEWLKEAPHLFARAAVFVDHQAMEAMRRVVAATERVVSLPAYRAQALRAADAAARIDTPARGACLGFDFHLSADGPQLIEINTNAGGALLNAYLRRAQRVACEGLERFVAPEPVEPPEEQLYAMFLQEWRAVRGDAPLSRIAIVDDAPAQPFLAAEFELFERLFIAHGRDALICDPNELTLREGRLWHGERAIDLVYNRLTDFNLTAPEHSVLREAHRTSAAVITPHPQAHALYADKRRLCTLSDRAALLACGAQQSDADLIAQHVPRTIEVEAAARDALWQERKAWFFKPHSGYGSKAAYRGEKLTKSAFEHILGGGYVAQQLKSPSSRTLCMGDEKRALKLDVRCFAYAGAVQLVCARLYTGQTTNFRTQGGGFAPVYEIVD